MPYDEKGRMVAFKNKEKREGRRDADYKGKYTDEDGKEYWVNIWVQTPKNGGDKFLSGSIQLKQAKSSRQPNNELNQAMPRMDDSSELPD